MRRRLAGLIGLIFTALTGTGAGAASAGQVAYLKDGAAWTVGGPGQVARRVPGSRGAVLLAVSPTGGTLAFLTGPPGASVHAGTVPLLTPFLSAPPYTASVPWKAVVPDPALWAIRARRLTWEGDGRNLIVGTDGGTLGWHVRTRQSFIPNQTTLYQSTSRDGKVSATLGSSQSPDDVGVLLSGPGARPGTEVFTRRQPQNLLRALRAEPQPALRRFVGELDPRVQADDASWTVTPPQVTRDGKRVYFASNAGWGVGSAGSTTSAVFEVDVDARRVRALGWLGTLSGSVLEVRPSPDGRRLLILVARHTSNAEVNALAYAADLGARTVRELIGVDAPGNTLSVLDSACWLADSRHVALSVAFPRPQDLNAGNGFEPPARAHTLVVKDAASGRTRSRVPGATGVACGPR